MDEQQAIDHLIARLADEHPGSSEDHVREVVLDEHRRYDGRPVRDFVPVLVERAARKRLGDDPAAISVPMDDAERAVANRTDDPQDLDPMERERIRGRKGGFLFGDLGGGPS